MSSDLKNTNLKFCREKNWSGYNLCRWLYFAVSRTLQNVTCRNWQSILWQFLKQTPKEIKLCSKNRNIILVLIFTKILGGYILRTGYILWQVNLSGYILCHWLHFVVGKIDAKCNRLHFVAGYILRPYNHHR